MSKSGIIIAAGLSLLGLIILGTCIYCSSVYGGGDTEVGNFFYYVYYIDETGVPQCIEPPTGEGQLWQFLNAWAVGAVLFCLRPTIWALNYTDRRSSEAL